MVNLIATVHPFALAFWCFVIGAAFAWLVNDTAVLIRRLREQRRRESAFLDREGRA